MTTRIPPVRPFAGPVPGKAGRQPHTDPPPRDVVELPEPQAERPEPEPEPPPASRGSRLWRHSIGLIGFSLLLIAGAALRTDGFGVRLPGGATLPNLCALRYWTGLPCPGCGLTRCFISLCHGDLEAAWAFSPAGILFFALVAVQIPMHVIQLGRAARGLPEGPFGRWSGSALVVVALLLIAQWTWRIVAGMW